MLSALFAAENLFFAELALESDRNKHRFLQKEEICHKQYKKPQPGNFLKISQYCDKIEPF